MLLLQSSTLDIKGTDNFPKLNVRFWILARGFMMVPTQSLAHCPFGGQKRYKIRLKPRIIACLSLKIQRCTRGNTMSRNPYTTHLKNARYDLARYDPIIGYR